MRTFIILSCMLAVVVSGKYTTKYDNTNVKEVLDNPRLYEGYKKCVMEQGPCTSEGQELKSHIKEALENGCADCTDKQLEGVEIVFKHMSENDKEGLKEMRKKYDPEDKYFQKYREEADKRGIKIE